jgi:peptide/nickel transport system substrate-binding protein
MKRIEITLAVVCCFGAGAASAAGSLKIGLQDDPDFLDPARSRSYVSRIVFASLCDKLIDTTPDLKFVPQLATSWTWSPDNKVLTLKLRTGVTFHDGEPFDAEAVKFNLDRDRTLPESVRKSEIASVDHVDVVDPQTVNIVLKQPDAALVAQLTDRAGMMVAPKASSTGNVTASPVCSGPYKFVERVAQDRIVLERFPQYWNAGAYHFDRVTFMPIADTTVRLANLQSGGLDLIERMASTDVKNAAADPKLSVISIPGLGFNTIELNVTGDHAKTPLGQDSRVRQAFDLAIDRSAINDAVFEGRFTPGAQPFAPASYYHLDQLVPGRDVDKAKALLKAAGATAPVKVALTVANDPVTQQVGQVIQAMTAEAGFDVQLKATEFATLLSEAQAGNFEANMTAWSGRVDPDGNIHQFLTCKAGLNDMKYCNPEVDALLNGARTVTDPAERKAKYAAAMKIINTDKPILYLYFEPHIFGAAKALHGFVPHPDGMIRLQNVTLDR